MLALREEEAFVVLAVMITLGVVVTKVVRYYVGLKEARLRVLEQALQNPQLDPTARRELVERLDSGGLSGLLQSKGLTAVGWIGMFLGLGMIASGDHTAEEVGPVVALVAFGFVSLPFALRELDHRKPAKNQA